MKYFLILLLLFLQLEAKSSDNEITIGAGPYIQSQPYKDASALVLPSPVIFFDNSVVYARWSRFGLYFLGDKKEDYLWGASLTIQPRTLGYTASDSDFLQGMQNRDSTLEGGIALSAKSSNSTFIELMLLADVLNKYKSYTASIEIGNEIHLGKFSLYPSLMLSFQPKKFIDYYYGVTSAEARLNRPAYSPHGGVNIGVQTYIQYPFTDKLSAFFNIRADKIPDSAYNSPLVNNKLIYSGLASLIYTFEY